MIVSRTDFSMSGITSVRNNHEVSHVEVSHLDVDRSHHTFRETLVTHFNKVHGDNGVWWFIRRLFDILCFLIKKIAKSE